MHASNSGLAPLVGRSAEIRTVTRWLRQSRVVVLRGPFGVGKTRLALEVTHKRAGAVFVELSNSRTVEDIVRATACALELRLHGPAGGWPEQVGRELDGVLLVLDNCEQAVAAVAAAAQLWLSQRSALRLLLTSRVAPGIPGERVLDLLPLPEGDAIELFVRAAQRYAPLRAEGPALSRLVHALDRLPLALEMAAARTRVLSPEAILARLGGRLQLLRAEPEGLAERSWLTLREAISWSWELLTGHARDTLAACSVFRGHFDVDLAEAVTGHRCTDELEELVSSSLLVRSEPAPGEVRFRLLESLRAYLLERPRPAGLEDRLADAMLERWKVSLERRTFVATEAELARMALDLDDLAASVTHCLQSRPDDGYRLLCLLTPLMRARGAVAWLEARLAEALERPLSDDIRMRALNLRANVRQDLGQLQGCADDLDAALQLAGDHPPRVVALLCSRAAVERDLGRIGVAEQLLRRAMALSDRDGNDFGRGHSRGSLASLLLYAHRLEGVRELLQQSMELQTSLPLSLASGLLLQGRLEFLEGHPLAALIHYDRAVELLLDEGAQVLLAQAYLMRGGYRAERGQHEEAREDLQRSLEIRRQVKEVRNVSGCLRTLASMALDQGELSEGERLARESLAHDERYGNAVSATDSHVVMAVACWATGRREDALEAAHAARAGYLATGIPTNVEVLATLAALGPAEQTEALLAEARASLFPAEDGWHPVLDAIARVRGLEPAPRAVAGGAPLLFARVISRLVSAPPQKLELVARWETAHLVRPGRPVAALSGNSARILSELVALGAPAPWQVVAREVWREDAAGEEALRKRWDKALSRLRSQLRSLGIRADLVRSDRHGNIELVLEQGELATDAT
jgi:predicted ATPase